MFSTSTNSKNSFSKVWVMSIILFLILLVVFYSSNLLSKVWQNLGSVLFVQALMMETSLTKSQAELFLERAIEINPQNLSAVRQLGFILLAQGSEDEAIKVWQNQGTMSSELLERGHYYRQRVHDQNMARVWYERAAKVAFDMGEPWYYVGLSYQEQKKWKPALEAYGKVSIFRGPGISDWYFQRGKIYQSASGYRDFNKALVLYDLALQTDSFKDPVLKALAYYERGYIYDLQKRDLKQVIDEYQNAIAITPNHYWARLRLGYAIYWAYKDVSQAEKNIYRAIALWPQGNLHQSRPYKYLGEIYLDAGLKEKAIQAYQEALRLEPDNENIKSKLNILLRENQ